LAAACLQAAVDDHVRIAPAASRELSGRLPCSASQTSSVPIASTWIVGAAAARAASVRFRRATAMSPIR
jgi:hypothetical protein